MEITEVQLLPQSLDKNYKSGSSFDLHLKPAAPMYRLIKARRLIIPVQGWREIIITVVSHNHCRVLKQKSLKSFELCMFELDFQMCHNLHTVVQ